MRKKVSNTSQISCQVIEYQNLEAIYGIVINLSGNSFGNYELEHFSSFSVYCLRYDEEMGHCILHTASPFLIKGDSIFPLLAGHILFNAAQNAILLSLWQEHYWLSCNMVITITLNGAGLLLSHFLASTGVGGCSIPAAGLCTSAWMPQYFFTFLKVPWNLSSSLHLLIILNVELCLSHFEGM